MYGHTFVFEHSDLGTVPDYELSLFFDANPWLKPYEWMMSFKNMVSKLSSESTASSREFYLRDWF
ncbi:uncharacterized protein ANIA_11552 [Aspergillus nidulans FGSC A4]|uniref:Uncharacterized protein n=1 Tax=Emericella nidulans (strain FGSC A4 / ATCC 38163 / CBS 112.46 / NRRL 194 / M139) TaxID=227321 RepID=C8VCS8_EMENI|nr:hypothetical protein [Aspergillus nidulans FGSC A4]CBF78708.1 TPA: hypothetical protein ANIA_11552 [Aspergillus nidulans FGSC A4]